MVRQTQTNSAGILFNSLSQTSHQISEVISYITVKSTQQIRDHLRDFTSSWRRRRREILFVLSKRVFDLKSRNPSIHTLDTSAYHFLHSLQLKNERKKSDEMTRQTERMNWNEMKSDSLSLFPLSVSSSLFLFLLDKVVRMIKKVLGRDRKGPLLVL